MSETGVRYCIRHNGSHRWLVLGREEATEYIKGLTGCEFILGESLTFISGEYDISVFRLEEGDWYNEYENKVHKLQT